MGILSSRTPPATHTTEVAIGVPRPGPTKSKSALTDPVTILYLPWNTDVRLQLILS